MNIQELVDAAFSERGVDDYMDDGVIAATILAEANPALTREARRRISDSALRAQIISARGLAPHDLGPRGDWAAGSLIEQAVLAAFSAIGARSGLRLGGGDTLTRITDEQAAHVDARARHAASEAIRVLGEGLLDDVRSAVDPVADGLAGEVDADADGCVEIRAICGIAAVEVHRTGTASYEATALRLYRAGVYIPSGAKEYRAVVEAEGQA